MIARDIITDAYEQMNRLSPGEPLSSDDASFGLRRLNLLVDEMSAVQLFLYRDVLTSAAQTGNVTLGAGAWSAIAPGSKILSVSANGMPLDPVTIQQYNGLANQGQTGFPSVFAVDGLGSLFLFPVPAGQTIRVQARVGVAQFADLETDYVAPQGYRAALGCALAVRMAPTLLGGIPPGLEAAEARCMAGIQKSDPAIVDVDDFTRGTTWPGAILRGF